MKKFLSLFLSLFVVFSVFSQDVEFRAGAVYVYSGQVIEQYTTVAWKRGHTYEVNNLLSVLSHTNQSILYFSNELIARVDTNTVLNIVTFDQEIVCMSENGSIILT